MNNAIDVSGAPRGINCLKWAFNLTDNQIDFNDVIQEAVNAEILWPQNEQHELLADSAMLKRVFEAFLYASNANVKGYRATGATPVGWHRIRLYHHALEDDFHFSTETVRLSNGSLIWTEKGGWKAAAREGDDQYGSLSGSTSLGEYYINSPPRTWAW